MTQEALIVNPYEVSRVADYLHRSPGSIIISWTYPDLYSALTMSVAEAEVRMTALRARERGHDLRHWTDSFLSQLLDSAADGASADKVVRPETR